MGVSTNQKRVFIKWYLDNYKTERREMVWLLEYILKREHILQNIHFVFEAHLCPRSIIISTDDEVKRPFRYYKDHVVTTDVDKAFHDIRLNPDETMYVEIIFDGNRQSVEYAEVLEDNPYLPDDYYLENEDYIFLENILEESSHHSKINILKNKIDYALDIGDVQSFNKWSKELKDLMERKKYKS
ncbi:ReoY family proteolytic degradation factor [Piscibacillus halophilus]|uniref:ReoY family proteolytic degradation factor n=1 Tax=Piscibacillus halophilus TaxID=571933 RepID=UPI00240A9BD0|nr:ReoY family proteolytic degradation factor [Piscibacillus halophilus]